MTEKTLIATTKSRWLQQLASMDHEDDDPGTTWNERARNREPERMSPRMAWRAIQAALPPEAIISTDIGNNCAIGNAYPTFEEGRKYLAPGQMIGLPLTVEPMSRESYFFKCASEIEPLPFLKSETDLAIRPEGSGYVGGVPNWRETAGWNFEPSPDWFNGVVWPALARRVPAMEELKLERVWRGHYARNTLDYSPIIGRWTGGCENVIIATGFSGHGIMHAPATGRAVAELVLDGGYQTLDLTRFGYQRIVAGIPVKEIGIV